MARVRWKTVIKSNTTNISGYKISLKKHLDDSYNETTTRGNWSSVTFFDLSAYTTYHYKIIGFLDNGDRMVSRLVKFNTLAQIPKPRFIEVLQVTSNTCSVQWQKIVPNRELYGDVLGYKSVLSSKGHGRIITSFSNYIFLKNLAQQTKYKVTIRGFSKLEDGMISNVTNFTTLAQIPKPQFVEVLHITFETAVVEWERIRQNKDLYGELLGYKITVLSNRGLQFLIQVKSINTYRRTLKNLFPDTTYNITIRGYSQNEDGDISDVVNFTTSSVSPLLAEKKEALPLTTIGLIIGLIIGSILLVMLIAVGSFKILSYRRKMILASNTIQMRNTNTPFDVNLPNLNPERHNIHNGVFLEEHSEWELSVERLTIFNKTLGGGNFGIVKEGIYNRSTGDKEDHVISVAIKTLRRSHCTTESEELLRELEILKHVNEKGHPNVIGLIGACTQTDPVLIVMEYCQGGNLRELLISSRVDSGINPGSKNIYSEQKETQFISIASDVANGLFFLHEKKVIHRDIASRNILIDDNLKAKIADFGLSRKIDAKEHYIVNKNRILPVKWMALESLEEGIFTLASDIWSYGILLWEICTLGKDPYPKISPYEILHYLRRGNRMEQPIHSSNEIFTLMESCWLCDPATRPKIEAIHESLQNILADQEIVYVDIKKEDENVSRNSCEDSGDVFSKL